MKDLERAEFKDRVLKFLNEARRNMSYDSENLYSQLGKPVPSVKHLQEILEEMHSEAGRYFSREFNNIYGFIYERNEFTQELVDNGGFVELFKERLVRQQALLRQQEEEAVNLEIERKKNKYQAKLARWQVITFWPLFFLGIIGGGYSIYQIADKILNPKEVVTMEEFLQLKERIEKPAEPIKDTVK